jgi:hypothetical protein
MIRAMASVQDRKFLDQTCSLIRSYNNEVLDRVFMAAPGIIITHGLGNMIVDHVFNPIEARPLSGEPQSDVTRIFVA